MIDYADPLVLQACFWIKMAMFVLAVVIVVLWAFFTRPRRTDDVKALSIAFVHPDLGIGGAERLVVDAAVALQQLGHKVWIYTARHDPSHCFKETEDGTLRVIVHGDFLPRRILGRFYAACAYLRMCYVSCQIVLLSRTFCYDIIIVDQVSICLPILRLARPCGIIFYCHYPDYLLTQRASLLKRLYRMPLDSLEELTTGLADVVFVNSEFTAGVFAEAFPYLNSWGIKPSVLYPALNLKEQDDNAQKVDVNLDFLCDSEKLLLSLNRFERKKNIGLAIRAFAALPEDLRQRAKLVVAGGYDSQLPENVEHASELEALAQELGVKDRVIQKWSISTELKATLLHHATCLMYTPDREHFGIVPVEAMYARVPVLAINSGGPLESVADDETGFLRPGDPGAWAACVGKLLENDSLKKQMGDKGRQRVEGRFSLKAFGQTLNEAAMRLAIEPANSSSSKKDL